MKLIDIHIAKIKYLLILFIGGICLSYGQTFTHSGYVYGANSTGVAGVYVYLYKRTTPVLTGFTSQQNYNGHSYYRSTGNATWTVARQNCINMGGHLVTVTSAAENTFIFNLWPSGWIGLTDELVEGQWKWVTGESYSYTSWNGGEPNNAGNEDYVQFVGGGKWNDLPNGYSLPYVIEFDYIVDYTPWEVAATSITDLTGRYSFSVTTNPSVQYYISFTAPAVPSLTQSDSFNANQLVLQNVQYKSVDFYRFDVNGDSKFTVSDVYSIHAKRNGILPSFKAAPPETRIFTSTQWTVIAAGSINTKVTYPGVQTITLTNPTSGAVSNFYMTRVGLTN